MLKDLRDDGAVLRDEGAGPLVVNLGLVDRLGVDPQRVVAAGSPGPDPGATEAGDDGRRHVVVGDLLDLGDRPDRRIPVVDAREQDEATVRGPGGRDRPSRLLGLDRDGHDHVGEDDAVAERKHRQRDGGEVGQDAHPFADSGQL